MRNNNVKHGLLLSPPFEKSGCLPNTEILDHCEETNGTLVPVVTVEPTSREVREAINLTRENRNNVKAFKIRLGYVSASAENPVFHRLYDYAESEQLPVMFHTGDTAFHNAALMKSHPLALDAVANERENLTIVLCHFGNPWFIDTAEMLYKHPNVYADTSGLITNEGEFVAQYENWLVGKLSEAIHYAGSCDKILFGTDWPVSKYPEMLRLIRRLSVTGRDKQKILYDNAQRLFHF